jgi:hypothetical protein
MRPDPSLKLRKHEWSARQSIMSSSDERPANALTLAAEASPRRCRTGTRGRRRVRALIAGAVRLYAVKAESGMRAPPPGGGGVTITDAMVTVTDILHALNVRLFDQHVAGDDRQLHRRTSGSTSPIRDRFEELR